MWYFPRTLQNHFLTSSLEVLYIPDILISVKIGIGLDGSKNRENLCIVYYKLIGTRYMNCNYFKKIKILKHIEYIDKYVDKYSREYE